VQEPFIGSEALASGTLTRHQLRSRFVAVHPDVYLPAGADLTARTRAYAAWLWSRRRGVVAGQSASVLHGAKWVDDRTPAQLLYQHRRPPQGIRIWLDRVADDEVQLVAGMAATTPARTAFDLACRNPIGKSVAALDALARATRLDIADVELIAERYKGHRNIRRARAALNLVDAGSESPRETWLRLLLVKAGYLRPQTQIPVYGPRYGELVAVVDMGWQDIKVGVEYEGDHHRTDRRQFNRDIARFDALTELGWIIVRVTVEDVPGGILRRVAAAWSRRTCSQGVKIA